MFGEKATTDITKETDSKGLKECKDSAKEGGQAANEAKKSVEKRLGKSIISEENFLPKKKEKKRLSQ